MSEYLQNLLAEAIATSTVVAAFGAVATMLLKRRVDRWADTKMETFRQRLKKEEIQFQHRFEAIRGLKAKLLDVQTGLAKRKEIESIVPSVESYVAFFKKEKIHLKGLDAEAATTIETCTADLESAIRDLNKKGDQQIDVDGVPARISVTLEKWGAELVKFLTGKGDPDKASEDFRKKLTALVGELDPLFERAADDCRKIDQAISGMYAKLIPEA